MTWGRQIFEENKDRSKECGVAGCLERLVPCSCEPLIVMTLRLLYNLSFDADVRWVSGCRHLAKSYLLSPFLTASETLRCEDSGDFGHAPADVRLLVVGEGSRKLLNIAIFHLTSLMLLPLSQRTHCVYRKWEV